VSTNDILATTLADHLIELGSISAARVLLDPPPQQAKTADLIRVNESNDKGLYDLVDGTLVEKAMSYEASVVAATILFILKRFLSKHRLGLISGADGFFKLSLTTRAPDAEMARKRLEYFHAGVKFVWIVDFTHRSVVVYTSPSDVRVFGEEDAIDGGNVLPDFTSPIADFFVDLDFGNAPA